MQQECVLTSKVAAPSQDSEKGKLLTHVPIKFSPGSFNPFPHAQPARRQIMDD